MRRTRKQLPRTKRLNLCLTEPDYQELVRIGEREDRDAGDVASLLVAWAIEQYKPFNSLVRMRASKIVREERIVKNASGRKRDPKTFKSKRSGKDGGN